MCRTLMLVIYRIAALMGILLLPAGAQPLTQRNAVAAALANHPGLEAQREKVASAEGLKLQAVDVSSETPRPLPSAPGGRLLL